MLEYTLRLLSPWVPFVALSISILSLLLARKSRSEQRQVFVFSKRIELVSLLAQRLSKIGQLELVCAQKIIFLQGGNHADGDSFEIDRLRGNLQLLIKERKNCEWQLNKIRSTPLTDIQALESVLATATEFLVHVTAELEKEQQVFDDLRERLLKDA